MAKESKRQKQVAEVIKRNFGIVLQQEGGYIYGQEALVTVTSVKISPDLNQAKIYISIYNTDNKQAILLQMEEEHHRLKSALAGRIRKHVRRIPDFQVYIDETLDEMYRMDELFNRINNEKKTEE